MVTTRAREMRRVLCEISEVAELASQDLHLSEKAIKILDLDGEKQSSNYGLIMLNEYTIPNSDFGAKINSNLAQKLGLSKGDYLEILKIDGTLVLTPILKNKLRPYFYNSYGADKPRVILLSSHAEFEPFTREVATRIHERLEESAIPSRRIEIRKHSLNGECPINVTISRYEVDITRKKGTPEKIGTKLVNDNLSYRILSEIYFQLILEYLPSEKPLIVVDIHGIATRSSTGILHPMVIIGDAFTRNLLVKKFRDTIYAISKARIPNFWIVYRPPWGSVEHSLQLVKSSGNIPIIIEIRRDLRDDMTTRKHLISLIVEALVKLVEDLEIYISTDKKIIFRRFVESDLAQIRRIYLKAYEPIYGAQTGEQADLFLSLFKSALKEDVEGKLFVAEKNNRVKGFAVIHKEPTDAWKFGPIAVVPYLQHRGLGAQLLQLCVDFIRSRQVKQFYLKVHEDNQAAINLYNKFGFKMIQTLPSNIEGKNYLKMVRDLSP